MQCHFFLPLSLYDNVPIYYIIMKTMRTITQRISIVLAAVLLLTSCYNAGSGLYNGASVGAMLGGALGGLHGGPYGYNRGTAIGIIVGGAAGAAVGAAREARRERDYEEVRAQYPEQRRRPSRTRGRDRRDTRQADPRDDGYGYGQDSRTSTDAGVRAGDYPLGTSEADAQKQCPLTLRNLRFVGIDGKQSISRDETCQIVFELANSSGREVLDIVPYVFEANGNEHLQVSPTTRIESIRNGDAIRYTADVKADKKLKEGTANFYIQVSTDGGDFVTLETFSIPTVR